MFFDIHHLLYVFSRYVRPLTALKNPA